MAHKRNKAQIRIIPDLIGIFRREHCRQPNIGRDHIKRTAGKSLEAAADDIAGCGQPFLLDPGCRELECTAGVDDWERGGFGTAGGGGVDDAQEEHGGDGCEETGPGLREGGDAGCWPCCVGGVHACCRCRCCRYCCGGKMV